MGTTFPTHKANVYSREAEKHISTAKQLKKHTMTHSRIIKFTVSFPSFGTYPRHIRKLEIINYFVEK